MNTRDHREILVIEFLKSKKHLLKFAGISKETGIPVWVLKDAMHTYQIPSKYLDKLVTLLSDFGLSVLKNQL